jgi:NAD/NADP transhydrogenase beta subunit
MVKWSERPKGDRGAIIGAIIGMAIAAVVAIVFAYDSSTMVRYLIMAAGLLLGLGAGKLIASRP